MWNKDKLKRSINKNLKFVRVGYLYTFDLQNKYFCKKKSFNKLKMNFKI